MLTSLARNLAKNPLRTLVIASYNDLPNSAPPTAPFSTH